MAQELASCQEESLWDGGKLYFVSSLEDGPVVTSEKRTGCIPWAGGRG